METYFTPLQLTTSDNLLLNVRFIEWWRDDILWTDPEVSVALVPASDANYGSLKGAGSYGSVPFIILFFKVLYTLCKFYFVKKKCTHLRALGGSSMVVPTSSNQRDRKWLKGDEKNVARIVFILSFVFKMWLCRGEKIIISRQR